MKINLPRQEDIVIVIFAIYLVLIFSSRALATSCEHTETSIQCAEYISNYDGDTIKFNIPGLHPIIGKSISVRLLGIDTPEIRTKDSCEKKLGKKAKKVVRDVLRSSPEVTLFNIERGKYFRILANVKVRNIDLSSYLISKYLGVPYFGGKRDGIDWCEILEKHNE